MKNLFWVGVMLSVFWGIEARDRALSSPQAFYKTLSNAPYSVVMFYDKSKENMKDAKIKQQIYDLESMFRFVSDDSGYKEVDLRFLRVDVNRKQMRDVANEFTITTFPYFMLFIGREPVEARLGGSLSQGYLYRSQLEAFINAYLKDRMDAYFKQKSQAREIALEKAKIRAYDAAAYAPWSGYYGPYGYPYWWYGYPYGYGYGGGSPYVGFSFGF